jgi:hypothetical protein
MRLNPAQVLAHLRNRLHKQKTVIVTETPTHLQMTMMVQTYLSSSGFDWPAQVEEVFPLPPGIAEDFESVCDDDMAAYDNATLYCPPRWAYTIRDLDIYAKLVNT